MELEHILDFRPFSCMYTAMDTSDVYCLSIVNISTTILNIYMDVGTID